MSREWFLRRAFVSFSFPLCYRTLEWKLSLGWFPFFLFYSLSWLRHCVISNYLLLDNPNFATKPNCVEDLVKNKHTNNVIQVIKGACFQVSRVSQNGVLFCFVIRVLKHVYGISVEPRPPSFLGLHHSMALKIFCVDTKGRKFCCLSLKRIFSKLAHDKKKQKKNGVSKECFFPLIP